ncbi:HAD-IA family hydrolase [Bdellovibrio sp. HCB290]|uniref:HAD-IA family hydrolase n=1 Tax=Bdellovibrio sp. HCB290 TaxID=3394356 RepID=UPI0039B37F53
MERFDSVIFDLDGTLWDTTSSCAIAWNNVLSRRGIPFRTITADDVRKVTGKPHDTCIREIFVGLPEEQLQVLIEDTKTEDNLMVSQLGGTLYEGVIEGLTALQKKYPLFIVSNCQSGYIETFLKFAKLEHLFVDIECWGNTGKPKAENLKLLAERNRLQNPVYVGDTTGDHTAARANGFKFYFAEYGFEKNLESDFSFGNFTTLVNFLLENEDIKILRQFYSHLNNAETDAAVSLLDASIFRTEPSELPQAGTYRGLAEMRDHIASGRATWAEGACEPMEFFAKGNKIVVTVHVKVRLKDSTEWIDAKIADGYALNEGRITEFHTFLTKEKAFAWGGITK